MTYFILRNPSGDACATIDVRPQLSSEMAEYGWKVEEIEGVRPLEKTCVRQIKEEAGRRILERYPGWKQINAALGLYDAAAAAAMKDGINAVRAASDAIEVRLASDPYLDPAVQPDWPQS